MTSTGKVGIYPACRNSERISELPLRRTHNVLAGVKPPGHHLKDLVIYETHVRGFTRTLGPHMMQLRSLDHCTGMSGLSTSQNAIPEAPILLQANTKESRQQAAGLGRHSRYIPRQVCDCECLHVHHILVLCLCLCLCVSVCVCVFVLRVRAVQASFRRSRTC